ncbi:MAG: phosphoribosylaminoimidazolesuccinocarboxamide synthase [Candidatus Bathyarchaeota archaeon]|jgi:phosphoribosylaminoimidazole-succinocarboxamide synthase
MGSVKDLEIIQRPTEDVMGVGRFHFSDRYSIFDWGEMPDHIEDKGAALCLMGAYCFEKLEEEGVETHYRGLITKEGNLVRFEELDQPTDIMEFDMVNVIKPETRQENEKIKYDYNMFTPLLKNYLIPLEIIYRNSVPKGSSLLKRLSQGSITIEELDLDHHPKAGERFQTPVFDVSTKLEEKDRYLTWKEAQEIAGLTSAEVNEVKNLLLKVDKLITRIARKTYLENEDGKIELAFDPERKLIVVDVVGTLDECRFTYDGVSVSKEIARRYYRKTDWYKDVEEAKHRAEDEGVKDWRTICPSTPIKLPPSLIDTLRSLYVSASNELTGTRLFEAPTLSEIVEEIRET